MPRGRVAKSKAEKLRYIEDNSIPEPTTGCRIWLGELNATNYPKNTGVGPVHRWLAEEVNGLDLTGLFACHWCGHAWCVEASHMYAGTPKQNSDDAKRHGTFDLHLDGLRKRWSDLSNEEREKNLAVLNTGMRKKWDSMSKEERTHRARNSRKNIDRWEASLTPEELAEAYKKRGQGPARNMARMREEDPVAYREWAHQRALKSAQSRINNRIKRAQTFTSPSD